MARNEKRFTGADFALRFLLALILVLATYNPTPYSFVDWVAEAVGNSDLDAVHFFVGVVILIGWVMLVRATLNSLGSLGLLLGVALIGTLVWLLYDIGLLTGSSFAFFTWIALIGISALLAVGLCWASLWRSLTGQYSVDEVED
jgi:hypothetical protein